MKFPILNSLPLYFHTYISNRSTINNFTRRIISVKTCVTNFDRAVILLLKSRCPQKLITSRIIEKKKKFNFANIDLLFIRDKCVCVCVSSAHRRRIYTLLLLLFIRLFPLSLTHSPRVFRTVRRHQNLRRAPSSHANDVTDHVQIGRDHHAAVRTDRVERQGRDHRIDTAHVGRDRHRDEGVHKTITTPLRTTVVRGNPRRVRPFVVVSAVPTAVRCATREKHTRARARGASRRDRRQGRRRRRRRRAALLEWRLPSTVLRRRRRTLLPRTR